MSITDELRTEAKGGRGLLYTAQQAEALRRIADRIEAEHEKGEREQYTHGYNEGYDAGFASADDYFTDKRETLEEHGWVRLPVDADGVLIHGGDKMVSPHGDVFIVAHMMLEDGTWTVHGWKPSPLHHHKTSVEDVLTEFAQRTDEIPNDKSGIEPFKALLAEYAAKLRLAGEEDA